jgi:hypothetical protein
VIAKLLEPAFPGRDELRAQAETVVIRNSDNDPDGGQSFWMDLEPDRTLAPSGPRPWMPVSGDGHDEDGMTIGFNLHTTLPVHGEGYLDALEIFRVDGNPIRVLPAANTLVVTVTQRSERRTEGPRPESP